MSYDPAFKPRLDERFDLKPYDFEVLEKWDMDQTGLAVPSDRQVWAAVWFGKNTLNDLLEIPVITVAVPHNPEALAADHNFKPENAEWYWGTVFQNVVAAQRDKLAAMADGATVLADRPVLALNAIEERFQDEEQEKKNPKQTTANNQRRTYPYASAT